MDVLNLLFVTGFDIRFAQQPVMRFGGGIKRSFQSSAGVRHPGCKPNTEVQRPAFARCFFVLHCLCVCVCVCVNVGEGGGGVGASGPRDSPAFGV